MRKGILVVVVTILTLVGCSVEKEKGPEHQYFSSADDLIELQFPAGWYENKTDNPYDLQCFSKDERMTTGVFLYKKEDLATDSTPQDLLQFHIDDLQSKRKHFRILEQEIVTHHDGKKLTAMVYSGDKSASKYYYRFTLIEFSESPGILLVVLQVAIPSYWDKHKPILEDITKSARIRLEELESAR